MAVLSFPLGRGGGVNALATGSASLSPSEFPNASTSIRSAPFSSISSRTFVVFFFVFVPDALGLAGAALARGFVDLGAALAYECYQPGKQRTKERSTNLF